MKHQLTREPLAHVAGMVLGVVVILITIAALPLGTSSSVLLTVLAQIAIGAFAWFVMKRSSLAKTTFTRSTPFKQLAPETSALILSCFALAVVNAAFTNAYFTSKIDDSSTHISTLAALALIVSIVFIAPIIEELFSRGVIYTTMRTKYGFIVSMIVTTVVFTLMHFDPIAFIYVPTYSVVLTCLYEVTGVLKYSVIAHFVINVIATTMSAAIGATPGIFIVLTNIITWSAVLFLVYKIMSTRSDRKADFGEEDKRERLSDESMKVVDQ